MSKNEKGAKPLEWALLVSFAVTVMVPLTGGHLHKLASTVFLLLCIAHTVIHRKRLAAKGAALLALVAACFVSGLFGMIFEEELPFILMLHRALSIAAVFFLAIHILVFHKKLRPNK